ncbi:MAG: pentapeptide repeat-containing protein [Bifidobacteriaceae bacterium]|nr:pentapeptide repeat-containing protein [Bifidobacteriaceae bacterium]
MAGNAKLTGAKLTGAKLTGAKLTGAKLAGAKLVGAKLAGCPGLAGRPRLVGERVILAIRGQVVAGWCSAWIRLGRLRSHGLSVLALGRSELPGLGRTAWAGRLASIGP